MAGALQEPRQDLDPGNQSAYTGPWRGAWLMNADAYVLSRKSVPAAQHNAMSLLVFYESCVWKAAD